MKKQLLFIALSSFSFGLSAQTIQASDFYATAGETFTTIYGNYVSPGSSGSGVTWDLSGISSSNSVLVSALSPSSMFPSATINLDYGGQSNLHANLSSNDYLVVGETASNTVITYTDPKKIYQFPMSLGTTYTDNFAGQAQASGVTLDRTGSVTFEVDGSGTLITPSGTFSDVLRIHTVHTTTDSYMGQSATAIIDAYYWLKAGYHNELACLQVITLPQGQQTTAFYLSTSLGIEENNQTKFVMYPNPTAGNVSLQYDFTIDAVEMHDLNGRLISVDFNQSEKMLDIEKLDAGIYYVTVYSNNNKSTQKLVKH